MSDYDSKGNEQAQKRDSEGGKPKKRSYLDFRDWWDYRNLPEKILVVLGFAILGVAAFGLFGWVIMLLWNWLMPDIFGLKEISYWQAWGLFLLSTLLFKGMGSDESSRPSDRRRRRKLKRYIRESEAGLEDEGVVFGGPVYKEDETNN